MESIFSIAKSVMTGLRRDMRVRVGVGAGASVLLSAGVLGLGGSITPAFLFASSTPQAEVAQLTPVPEASIIFPVSDKNEGFLVDRSTTTVFQVIESLPKAERFEMMLYNSGADEALKRAGTYTVFVPASAKFDYLPKGYIAKLSRTDAQRLALGHMTARALPLDEALSGRVLTLGNTSVSFKVNADGSAAEVGGAKVTKVYKASNGYVYIIDKVLVGDN